LALGLILGLGALPVRHALWGLLAAPPLLVIARMARVSRLGLLRGLSLALPILGGVALLVLLQRGAQSAAALLVRSLVSVLALRVLAHTTPISDLLRTLRRWGVPEVLCTTIALLHRYLFLLTDESTRMRRARAGRTLSGGRLAVWRARGGEIGHLFVRTVSRAERVHAAMRSRGGA
jgi:cobalt/nickel transport system permease protein